MPKTREEWIAENPCCCEPPMCPLPIFDCRSVQALATMCGATNWGAWETHGGWSTPPCEVTQRAYTTVTRTIAMSRVGGGAATYDREDVTSYALTDGTVCNSSTTSESTGVPIGSSGFELNPTRNQGATAGGYYFEYGESGENSAGDLRTVTDRLEYSGLIDNLPHLQAQADAVIAAALTDEDYELGGILVRGSDCTAELELVSQTTCPEIDPALPRSIRKRAVQLQLLVPAEIDGEPVLGEWFQATWDVVFFPLTGDPVVVETDVTREWTGTGTGEQSDPSWKLGTPYVMEAPDEFGETRMVNFRYRCFRALGELVQVDGEAYEIPEEP